MREFTLHHHDGAVRQVVANDLEVPYPEGKLIVSRTGSDVTMIPEIANHLIYDHRMKLSGRQLPKLSVMRSDATNMPVGARFNVIVFNQ